MTRAGVVACATLLAGPVLAQPTPSCPGDCDLDGVVVIGELLQGVNIFLAGASPAGCDELDDDRDGMVRVNELVLAVGRALGDCRLSGDAAAEAAAGAIVTTEDGFTIIVLGSAAAGAGGGNGLVADDENRATINGSSTLPQCTSGGSRDESCTIRSGAAHLTVVFDDCARELRDLTTLVIDGRLVRRVDDVEFCATRQIADGVEVDDQFTEFRQALVRSDQTGDTTLLEFSGTYQRRFVPDGTGCAGRTGSEIFNGALAMRCVAGPAGTLPTCPSEGRDLEVVARDLTVLSDSIGDVGACTRISTLVGRLESHDHVSGRNFDAVYRQLVVRETSAPGEAPATRLNGGLALDCLGEITVATEIALEAPDNARCPGNGLLFFHLPDGIQRSVRYRDGGVAIDLDGDGQPEQTAASCEDSSLAQCQ